MKRRLHLSFIIVIVILILTGTILFILLNNKLVMEIGEEVVIRIPYGTSIPQIAQILKESNLIKDETLFILTAKAIHYICKADICAGTYKFSNKVPMWSLLYKLFRGKTVKIKILIPEGADIFDIGRILEKRLGLKKNEVIKYCLKYNLEGFLFPDTYFFAGDEALEEVIIFMVNNFKKKVSPIIQDKIGKDSKAAYKILILASIIEKEVQADEERRIISSIFYNRLKKNKPLESCSTVIYAHKMENWDYVPQWKKLKYSELKINSPYNTYLHKGLPPGPICNPGIKSILAALEPLNTEYMYFFATSTGTHIFSKTYTEHIYQQRKYKQLVQEQ